MEPLLSKLSWPSERITELPGCFSAVIADNAAHDVRPAATLNMFGSCIRDHCGINSAGREATAFRVKAKQT